jgi:hypothetical protein
MRRSLAKPEDVATFLDVPEATLRQWRYQKVGPAYVKVGQLVRYDWSDIEAWVASQRRVVA